METESKYSNIKSLLVNLGAYTLSHPESAIRAADEVSPEPRLCWRAWVMGTCEHMWSISLSDFEKTAYKDLSCVIGDKEFDTLLDRYKKTSRLFSERFAHHLLNGTNPPKVSQETPPVKTSKQSQDTLRLRSGEVKSGDPLVSFLYSLLRDHLPVGTLEEILVDDVEPFKGQTIEYTNGYLARYAMDLANRLRG